MSKQELTPAENGPRGEIYAEGRPSVPNRRARKRRRPVQALPKPPRRRAKGPAAAGPGFGPPGLIGSGEKAKDFRAAFRRLVGRLRPEAAKVVIVISLAIVSVALTISGPYILRRAINLIYAGFISAKLPAGMTQEQAIAAVKAQGDINTANMLAGMNLTPGHGVDMGAVGKILLIVAAIYLVGALFSWLQGYLMAGVVQRIVYRLRREMTKLARLPLKYFDDHPRGDTLSRVTNDIDNIQQTLQQTLTQIVTAALTLIGVIGMMFWISPLLAVISLITIPLSVAVTMVIAKRSQKQFALSGSALGL